MDGSITKEMKAHFRASFLFRGTEALSEELENEIFANISFFAKGECVYESAHFLNALGVIVSGTVRITTSDEESRIILRDMSEGETFGAAALFGAGESYVSTIHAKTPCAVVFIEESKLTKLFSLYPETAVNYIAFLSSKIRYLNRKIAELSLKGADARVFDYMKKHADGGGKVAMPANMSALAKTLGIGRSSLYRALDSLEENGHIFKNGDEWEITKGEKTK